MDKKEIFNHFSNLLDEMIEESDFYKIYFQAPHPLDDDDDDDDDIVKNDIIRTGLSRGCIIDKNYTYVAKFNLIGKNDCKREIFIYNEAKKYNLNYFFTEPTFIGTYNKVFNFYTIYEVENVINWSSKEEFENEFSIDLLNRKKHPVHIKIDLYAYPLADICNFCYSYKEEKLAEKTTSPLREYNLAIAASFINDYGYEKYCQLTNFLYKYHINDLHLGNIGEINSKICLIDYAGC